MKRNFHPVALLLVGFLVTPTLVFPGERSSVCDVEYANDRLMVKAEGVPLGALLGAIQEKTGIEFIAGEEQSKRSISVQLGPLPLEEAVKRVLRGFNHSFLFDGENRLINVTVIGTGSVKSSSLETKGVGYTVAEASGRPDAVSGVSQVPKLSAGGDVQKLPEGMAAFPWKEKDHDSSSQKDSTTDYPPVAPVPMVIQPATEQMVVAPTAAERAMDAAGAEGMMVQPAGETKMTITPPTEPMVIQLPSGETISVKEPRRDISPKPEK